MANYLQLRNEFFEYLKAGNTNVDVKEVEKTGADKVTLAYSDEFKEWLAQRNDVKENDFVKNEINGEDVLLDDLFDDFTKNLTADDQMLGVIDLNRDGQVSAEEKANFFETIKMVDGDEQTISLDDFAGAFQQVQQGNLQLFANALNGGVQQPPNNGGGDHKKTTKTPPAGLENVNLNVNTLKEVNEQLEVAKGNTEKATANLLSAQTAESELSGLKDAAVETFNGALNKSEDAKEKHKSAIEARNTAQDTVNTRIGEVNTAKADLQTFESDMASKKHSIENTKPKLSDYKRGQETPEAKEKAYSAYQEALSEYNEKLSEFEAEYQKGLEEKKKAIETAEENLKLATDDLDKKTDDLNKAIQADKDASQELKDASSDLAVKTKAHSAALNQLVGANNTLDVADSEQLFLAEKKERLEAEETDTKTAEEWYKSDI